MKNYIQNGKKPLTNDAIFNIVKETAYIESLIDFYDIINNQSGQTTIFRKSPNGLTSSIKHIPEFPLSKIELSFIAAILQDPRVTMFMDDSTVEALKYELRDTEPLWKDDNIKYYDQNKDSDDFNNLNYRSVFTTLLKAINKRDHVLLTHEDTKVPEVYTPSHLEYSQKDDAFRLFVEELKFPINLEKIYSATITNMKPTESEILTETETLHVEIFDDTQERYQFNRAIRQFSFYKKTCRKSEMTDTYEMSVEYDKSDESKIIIKCLMYGPNMKVIKPRSVVDAIQERIKKQAELFNC